MRSAPALGAWRLLVAACGFVGFGFAAATFTDPWPALSQQASLLTGAVYLVLAVGGWSAPWVRGALTVLLALVCVTYLTVIGGDLDTVASVFEHLVTPLVVLADWVLVGRTDRARWWYPVLFPLLYLGYLLVADVRLYRSFLDPDAADFPATVAVFAVAVVATGYLLSGLARVRTTRSPAGVAR